jgi:hypothetical protein
MSTPPTPARAGPGQVREEQPSRPPRRGAGHDPEREPERERQRPSRVDRGARAVGGADEAQPVPVPRRVGRDPGAGRDDPQRRPRRQAVPTSADQRHDRHGPEHGRDEPVRQADHRREPAAVRTGRIVERSEQGVPGTADRELADDEAGDGHDERRSAGARLPQHPADAPAGEGHPGAEDEPADELGHGQQRRPTGVDAASESPDARDDEQRQEQELDRDGEGEGPKECRTAARTRPA